MAHVTPDAILQLGFGYWGSRTLLSAVELGVFSELGGGADCAGWMREAGFIETRVEHLSGHDGMVIGIKPQ